MPHTVRKHLSHSLIALAFFLALNFGIAAAGASFSTPLPEWYAALKLPPWAPPNWLYGPVWSVLYLCMAIAGWRLWRKREHPSAKDALAPYFLQLGCNLLWTLLFFGLHQIGWALLDFSILLWALGLAIWRAKSADGIAAMLLLPVILWGSTPIR